MKRKCLIKFYVLSLQCTQNYFYFFHLYDHNVILLINELTLDRSALEKNNWNTLKKSLRFFFGAPKSGIRPSTYVLERGDQLVASDRLHWYLFYPWQFFSDKTQKSLILFFWVLILLEKGTVSDKFIASKTELWFRLIKF